MVDRSSQCCANICWREFYDFAVEIETLLGSEWPDRTQLDLLSSSDPVHRLRQQVSIPKPCNRRRDRRTVVLKRWVGSTPIQITAIDCPHLNNHSRRVSRSPVHTYPSTVPVSVSQICNCLQCGSEGLPHNFTAPNPNYKRNPGQGTSCSRQHGRRCRRLTRSAQ